MTSRDWVPELAKRKAQAPGSPDMDEASSDNKKAHPATAEGLVIEHMSINKLSVLPNVVSFSSLSIIY